ncbi:MAG: hypothetical protein H7Y16_05255 [Candidatus Parcubacteria bacterium]|nr:hypothetical protein [Burkholderiales bacterium]
MIQSGKERRLVLRTQSASLISARQQANGDFTGTFRSERGEEKPVRLSKISEEQLPRLLQEVLAKRASRTFADEDKDWGVPPTSRLRTERMHAPTPKEVPGARTIRTNELRALQGSSPAPLLIDVLQGSGHRTLSGAHWLSGAGEGAGNAARERLRADLEKLTAGNKSLPVVFFCLSSECWLSYNASLRAIELGYTNIYWFRGGTAAWQRAGFAMMEAVPFGR